ncbi:Uncharacterized protein APZ42_008276 [Daphnia magna]|uniref:Uncharacterized protein n=1 Tax=Daphnia magna TaxID=35525 RepID=A0A164ERR4_9CRUS|nr:Uncharacterized protein APZ42_008276 [Daphnia magna]
MPTSPSPANLMNATSMAAANGATPSLTTPLVKSPRPKRRCKESPTILTARLPTRTLWETPTRDPLTGFPLKVRNSL